MNLYLVRPSKLIILVINTVAPSLTFSQVVSLEAKGSIYILKTVTS